MKKRTMTGIIILLVLIILFLLGKDYIAGSRRRSQGSKADGAVSEQQNENHTNQDSEQQQNQSGEQSKPQDGQSDRRQAADSSSDDGIEKAKEAALTYAELSADQVTFIKAKASKDDGRTEYDIEFVTADTKYEYELNASTYEINDYESKPIERLDLFENAENIITPEEAKAAALTALDLDAEAAILTNAELDFDDGRYEYDIEYFSNATVYSCEIDASTGDVLKIERDKNQIAE